MGREAESVASLEPGVASKGLDYNVHSVGGSGKAENLLRGDLVHSSLQRGPQILAISLDAARELSTNNWPQVFQVFLSFDVG